jgi:hypothetical protein
MLKRDAERVKGIEPSCVDQRLPFLVTPPSYYESMLDPSNTRRCGRCQKIKPLCEFAWRRKSKGQLDNYCRKCRAIYKKEHYLNNRQRYISNAASRRRRILVGRTRALLEFLKEHPCVDCGEDDVIVLEFDHLENKSFSVAYGIRNCNWESVLAEMAKCDVVCANCHRRRTAQRGGFLRLLLGTQSG